jgi:acetyl-CoA decarbonylase/synthase complex subunit beta
VKPSKLPAPAGPSISGSTSRPRARREDGRLVVEAAEGIALDPPLVGRALTALIRYEFPRLTRVAVELVFDPARLAALAPAGRAELAQRARETEAANEEEMDEFVTCTGCSPFAPDHVCVLTPQRPPQCGRPYEMIKTGALYGYDDMTHIHHRRGQGGLNSFGACRRGRAINAAAGEWEGVNQAVGRLSGGRTTRVQLHSLAVAPHTGCGCFRLICFRMAQPAPNIGIMDSKFDGRAPDGRTWRDLHYALGGKQAPGLAGGAFAYLKSPKFLAGDGGWESVAWVSPKVAEFMGGNLPPQARVRL